MDTIEKVATKLSGAGGPSGTDAVDLRNWLLRFGTESEGLRQVLAELTSWIANNHPPWATYHAMILCGLGIVPLAKLLREEVPEVLQPWYADDEAMSGLCGGIAKSMDLLQRMGPARGYFPEPEKSILICHPDDAGRVQQILGRFQFQCRDGSRYLGGYVGTPESREDWIKPQIEAWTRGVSELAKVATRFPQSAYAGLAKSLQCEWQYLQRVTPEVSNYFAPIEHAIATEFLPALLQLPAADVAPLRDRMALPVRYGGIGIPNPVQTADECYDASRDCTNELKTSLEDRKILDVKAYAQSVRTARDFITQDRNNRHAKALKALKQAADPFTARQMERARLTGAWLTTMPSNINGTTLAPEEFRDNLMLRLGLEPHHLPSTCDGCQSRFSVSHAFICRTGGLILRRHNEVASEWGQLCCRALSDNNVSDEPLIHSSRIVQGSQLPLPTAGARRRASAGTTNRSSNGTEVDPELRGDIGVHGFWKKGATTIFDVRVTDTDAPTYRATDPKKVLQTHEKRKKDKYNQLCLERRRHFTPLVFSVDGLQGADATAASKGLASLLAGKWNGSYSDVRSFV